MSPNSRPLNGGHIVSIKKLTDHILSLKDIEGVTVSGGEPFLQAEALRVLLSILRKNTNLSAIIYTGYTLQQLRDMHNSDVNEILDSLVDILIDGEYIEELNDGKSLKGSSNQCVHYLTDRYVGQKDLYESNERVVEFIVNQKELTIIGIPDKKVLESWEQAASSFEKK